MPRFFIATFALAVGLAVPAVARAETLAGKVVSVQSGDTLVVKSPDNKEYRVRLIAIDAPELKQAYGDKAKAALSDLVLNKEVRVETNSKDQYDRPLGVLLLGERNINRELVEEGWAWQFTRYDNSVELREAQERAKAAKKGLWADPNPISPWDFRKAERDGKPAEANEKKPANPN